MFMLSVKTVEKRELPNSERIAVLQAPQYRDPIRVFRNGVI